MANLQNIRITGDTLVLPSGTTAQRPVSPVTGSVRLNTDFTPPLLEIYDGSGWKTFSRRYNSGIGLVSSQPATRPTDILDAYPQATDGLYWINVAGTARQVYIDMRGGGWMLAARFNNSSSSWAADDAKWTNTAVLNETSSPTTNQDIKTYAWLWSDSGNLKVRWSLGFIQNYLEEWWYHSNGLRGIFSDTPYVRTNANWNVPRGTRHTRQDFEEWFNKSINVSGTPRGSYSGRAYQNGASGAFWSHCNMRGVNMRPNSGNIRVRYGTALNNETECASCDYYWGLGLNGVAMGSSSVGRRANYTGSGYSINTNNITGWCFVQ